MHRAVISIKTPKAGLRRCVCGCLLDRLGRQGHVGPGSAEWPPLPQTFLRRIRGHCKPSGSPDRSPAPRPGAESRFGRRPQDRARPSRTAVPPDEPAPVNGAIGYRSGRRPRESRDGLRRTEPEAGRVSAQEPEGRGGQAASAAAEGRSGIKRWESLLGALKQSQGSVAVVVAGQSRRLEARRPPTPVDRRTSPAARAEIRPAPKRSTADPSKSSLPTPFTPPEPRRAGSWSLPGADLRRSGREVPTRSPGPRRRRGPCGRRAGRTAWRGSPRPWSGRRRPGRS